MSERSKDFDAATLMACVEDLNATWHHRGYGCVLNLYFPNVLDLIASLQLALRHPAYRQTDMGQRIRGMVDDLIADLGDASPVMATFLRRGDDPDWDLGILAEPWPGGSEPRP